MNTWKKVKIGDFLTEREGRYKPDDKVISNYKRLEKIDFSGLIHISDKPSKTDMIVVRHGDLVISGINVAKGAIAVYQGKEPVCATIHYSSYTFDDKQVDLEYFKYFVKSAAFISALQKQVKGGIKTEIKPKHLLPLEITIPDLETQKEIVKKVSVNLKTAEALTKEIESQKAYVKQLRQNILQEAIEGKLTAEWRKNHPVIKGDPDFDADALFAEIQKKKLKNANGKKKPRGFGIPTEFQKQKARDCVAISNPCGNEKPFEIPVGWKCVRLGEISESCLGKMLDSAKNQGIPRRYLRNLNVRWFEFDLSDLLEMKIKDEEIERCSAHKGDLLICEGGYPGRSAIWSEDYDICFQKAVHRVRFYLMPNIQVLFNYYLYILSETNKIDIYLTGEGIKHLTGIKLKQIIYPLPPLKEQEEIVNKVEKLLNNVIELEQQIS